MMDDEVIERLKRLADSYLDHVLIALRADDRGVNFRNFLDPWWCFSRGAPFVDKRRDGGFKAREFNNPCAWRNRDRLPEFDLYSDGARSIVAKGLVAKIVDRKKHPAEYRLIIDHSVPFAVLSRRLWSDATQWDRDSLRDFLDQNMKRAVLSFAEDQVLNQLKLTSKMPHSWSFGDDPYARYAAAQLVF
jgi:hypothetical protein